MKIRIEDGLKCIMLPEGSKQAKKYEYRNTRPYQVLIERKTNSAVLLFDTVSEYIRDGEKLYLISAGFAKRIVWFNKKGEIVKSEGFTDLVAMLEKYIIIKNGVETRIIENPLYNPTLEFTTGEESFGSGENFFILPKDDKNKVIINTKTLQIYGTEFTGFAISEKAGLAVIKPVNSDKRKLVRLKDYAESKEYDNMALYEFGNNQISSNYVIIRQGNKLGIMRTSDFAIRLVECKKLTPIDNEYVMIHSDDGNNIMRLSDGKIAEW